MEEIIEKFKNNSDGIRVILLIHRSKEGGMNNKYKRHLRKVVTKNSEEFFQAIKDLKEIKDNDERPLRIYASCNNRDLEKAIHKFKQEQLDSDYADDEVKNRFYLDIKNSWISCLMRKSCRNEKNFLFDLDEVDDRSFHSIYNILEKQTEILNYYQTKNGYHIITKQFNYFKTLDKEIADSIQTDALMLIDY